jgi:hypothetical protein
MQQPYPPYGYQNPHISNPYPKQAQPSHPGPVQSSHMPGVCTPPRPAYSQHNQSEVRMASEHYPGMQNPAYVSPESPIQAGRPQDQSRFMNQPPAYAYYYQQGMPGNYYPVENISPDQSETGIGSWFEFSNSCYLKGLLIGTGITLLITNSTVQKALVRGVVKIWSLVQGGVEEVKEQFLDAHAEMSQEK